MKFFFQFLYKMSDEFGLERGWFDRVGYYSERDYIEYVQPAKRTIAQKFEMSTLLALTELKRLQWYSQEQENTYLGSYLYQHLKSLDRNTMNAAVFVLLGKCIDDTHTLLLTSKRQSSIEDVLQSIRKPPSKEYQEFYKKYGISVPDILRYLFYIQHVLHSKPKHDAKG